MSRCPKCGHTQPAPSPADFERLPTRDKERILERLAVNKGSERPNGAGHGALVRFEVDETGEIVAHDCR